MFNSDADAPQRFALSLSITDLLLLNNALNEVCNGIDMDDAEFQTRLGVNREQARGVLARISRLLDNTESP